MMDFTPPIPSAHSSHTVPLNKTQVKFFYLSPPNTAKRETDPIIPPPEQQIREPLINFI
jgi:hypothetical protein